ncbi:hypothetical protein JZ751_025859 [Albula glossodonta]|uniref:Ig-like domain-containing protein n=1 Tax=Albula glossodonta TaxID=121402 RepID=A0A8T2NDL5_9TELE|nr:hypothetical protein JZ751_025859 [Albula glossodonta]
MSLNSTVHASEGSSVILSFNYTSSVSSNSLHWYRQYPRSKPEFLLLIIDSTRSVQNATPPHPRLSATVNEVTKHVNLKLSSAEVTDSALYYCALRPTVTGNPYTLYKNLTPPEEISQCGSFEDSIKSLNNTVYASEGSSVILSCNYTSAAGLPSYLHWYRQYPRSKPEFLLLIIESIKDTKHVNLEISSAKVTDSALYYCALQPTVTGNP